MQEKLINLLRTAFEVPVNRQGSYKATDKYPDTFFTFWNNSTSSSAHYDNKPVGGIYDYDLNVYSKTSSVAFKFMNDAISLLVDAGFIIDYDPSSEMNGYDIASDEPSHIGRGIHIMFRK